MIESTDVPQEQEEGKTTPSDSSRRRVWLERYLAGMIITAVAAPWIGTAVLCIIAIGYHTSNGSAVLLGLAGGLIGWCILAVVAKQFVAIHRANPAVYRQLHARFQVLEAQIDRIKEGLRGRKEILLSMLS